MCILNAEGSGVNTGTSQLFDVIGYDSLGEPQATIGESLPLQAAISRSLGFNARTGLIIAAVVPAGTVGIDKLGKPAPEAQDKPVDASSAVNDSDAKDGAEDAGYDEPEPRSRADIRKEIDEAVIGWNYAKLPTLGLQFALLKHLDSIEAAILDGLVDCSAHIGIIAKSLERFAAQCIDRQPPKRSKFDGSLDWVSEEFDNGHIGETIDEELEASLNHWLDLAVQREHPEFFAEAEEEAPA